MTTTQGNLANLSRFVFSTPRWYASLGFALVFAGIAGIAAFEARFPLDDAWQGVFYIGIPTVAAAVFTTPIVRFFDGQLTRNRSSLLALACELVVIGLLTVAGIVAAVTPLGQTWVVEVLLFALATVFGIRLVVIMGVSRQSMPVAAVGASVQTVAGAFLLFVYTGTMRYLEYGGGPIARAFLYRPDRAPPRIQQLQFVGPEQFLLLGVICGLYAMGVYLFLAVIDRPWRSSLDVSVLDFVRGFIGHVAEGTNELEDFFESIGEDAVVPVTVLSARREDGTEKARFVLPMIHPGPMGEIGGGNLPQRVAAAADGLAFPPHATAGHDFNLVTEREVDTIIRTADEAFETIDYGTEASRSIRHVEGEATLTGQAFGDDALVVSTFAPGCADDVDYAVGLSAMAEARTGGLDDVLLVDAHNCNDGLSGRDLGHVVPGSERSFDLIHGAGRLGEQLPATERGALRCGTAWDPTPWERQDGIGPLGIRVGVFEVAGQTTAYVLVDGNNMEPGLRAAILDTVEGVDRIEVMTTDTHIVNTMEAENQVGGAVPEADLVALVDDLVGRAVADLEPVAAGMASEQAKVTVFGNDRTETLASTANAVVSMGGALAGLFVALIIAVSIMLFFLAG
jgi:putative membrane protein